MAPGYLELGGARDRLRGALNEDRGPWPPVIPAPAADRVMTRSSLNEDRGPWPPVMWSGRSARPSRRSTLNEDRGPWPPVIRAAHRDRRDRERRSTKTGGHGPRLSVGNRPGQLVAALAQRRPGAMAPGYPPEPPSAILAPPERSTKTGGHGPRLCGSCTSGMCGMSPLNEDRGPWPPVMSSPHQLQAPRCGAQRRPGAMAPGYLRVPHIRSVGAYRSTKTGGHGPRLCKRRAAKRSPLSPLNEDRGPWPPVIREQRSTSGDSRSAQRRPGAMAPGYP